MTDLRKAAQQALEALDCLEAPPTGAINHYELERRKNALRAALAEPTEPVVRDTSRMVMVNAGALQMVRNALKRDADEGKASRGEMLAELDKATTPADPMVPDGYKLLQDSTHDERSWPEDYDHENGCYMNTCVHCLRGFLGYKRRGICKVCAAPKGGA